MSECKCSECPNKGQPKCEMERLKFDVEYLRILLAKAEGRKINAGG